MLEPTVTPQFFKGDDIERKMHDAAQGPLDLINVALTSFYNEAYTSVPLGEFLFDSKRIPLTNAIDRSIFIRSFVQIFEAWSFCGTFEAYILVFKRIFGEDAIVEFEVPAPGKLLIDITSTGLQGDAFLAREIVDNEYQNFTVVDYDDEPILFMSVMGIESQSELEKVLFTMVPNGIYTEVSLQIGVEPDE